MGLEIRAVVHCDYDGCRSEEEVALTELVTSSDNSWDDRDVARQLDRAGWRVERIARDVLSYVCPDHDREDDDEIPD